MTAQSLWILLPLILPSAAALVALLATAFHRRHGLTLVLTLAGLAAGCIALPATAPMQPRTVSFLLTLDGYALYYIGLVYAAAFVVALMAYRYRARRSERPEEFYVLLLTASVGAAGLVASSHFASFFLSLEVLTVSLYALVGYHRSSPFSIEAGIKYLVLAGVSTAFLLFGMALVYAELGTMAFGGIAARATEGPHLGSFLLLAGMGLMVVGIGFKLALAPFHLWTPDVYQGAPPPATAFLATVSKGAMFALLLRYFTQVDVHAWGALQLLFTVLAVASMLAGALLALLQESVKRILAYSSIANMGYLLVAFLAVGPLGPMAVSFYLLAYVVTTLGAWGVVTVLSGADRDADSLEDFRGLAWRRPWLAGVLAVMLLSLAGLPVTGGFIGKFYLVYAGVGSQLWLLVVTLVISSAIGLFSYLRVLVALYSRRAPGTAPAPGAPMPALEGLVLALLAALLVWLGVYPATFITLLEGVLKGVE